MFNIEDERLLIDNLINNEDDSRIQTIAKISDQHTVFVNIVVTDVC